MNPSKQIDKQIAECADWRGDVMTTLRTLVHEADPDIVEEWRWGTGVYTHNGMILAISAFKNHVKINFFKGVHLKDSYGVLNAGFESKQHRSIDFHEGDNINEKAIKALIQEAVEYNASKQ